jgi:hypothetical protein
MSRAKPYRSNPTPVFMNNFDKATSERFYLVNENGPTKLTIEDCNRRKFKIQIGSEISCSCGGGRTEHCVHTIFCLIRIFKIDEADELIWQLAFTEREIQKILESRERNMTRHMNPWSIRAAGGTRAAAQRALAQEARDLLLDTGVDRALANLESDIDKILQKTHNRPTVE